MAAFLSMLALGGVISYAIIAWRDHRFWVRVLARSGVGFLALGVLVELLATGANLLAVEPGFCFVAGTAFAFGFALPGIIIYAMPK